MSFEKALPMVSSELCRRLFAERSESEQFLIDLGCLLAPEDSATLIVVAGSVSGVQADFADVSLERVGPELSGRKRRPGFSGVGRKKEIVRRGITHDEFYLFRRDLSDVEFWTVPTDIPVPVHSHERTLSVGNADLEAIRRVNVTWVTVEGRADAFSDELVDRSSVTRDVAEGRG